MTTSCRCARYSRSTSAPWSAAGPALGPSAVRRHPGRAVGDGLRPGLVRSPPAKHPRPATRHSVRPCRDERASGGCAASRCRSRKDVDRDPADRRHHAAVCAFARYSAPRSPKLCAACSRCASRRSSMVNTVPPPTCSLRSVRSPAHEPPRCRAAAVGGGRDSSDGDTRRRRDRGP